jgi:hypothetical protein
MSASAFVALNRRAVLRSTSSRICSSTTSWQQPRRCLATFTITPSENLQQEEKHRLTTIRLYRILQRACRSFGSKDDKEKDSPILLQPVMQAPDWGRHLTYTPPSPTMVEELYRIFYVWNDDAEDVKAFAPSSIDDWYFDVVGTTHAESLPPMTSMTCWTSTKQLQDTVRSAFRIQYKLLDAPSLHRLAIKAAQILHQQQILWSHSSVADTEGVRVTATSRYVL